MSVLMIIEAIIHDVERFSVYADTTVKLVIQFGGRYQVLGGHKSVLEGDWGEKKIVISEWPSREAVETFWNSPEYAEAKKLREGVAEVNVMVADTLSEEQWAAIVSANV